MRVLHLSTSPVGGAAIAGQRIHLAMRDVGIDSLFASRGPAVGFDSELVVPMGADDRWRSSLVTAVDRAATGRAASFFSPLSGRFVDSDWIRALAPEAIIVHNWFNLLGTSREGMLSELELPVLFVMHDERLFTGGCHHSGDCRAFHDECHACPQARRWARPLVIREHRLMRDRLPDRAAMVTPSRWLHQEATCSHLLRGRAVHYIPNPIDPTVFHPGLRAEARAALGFNDDDLVLAWQPGKGDELLQPVMALLRAECPQLPIRLLQTGSAPESGGDVVAVGALSSEGARAHFWAAADVAFSLTAFDNFPNVALEAMACAVPFVMPDVGGAGEAIRETGGGVVVPRQPVALARALARLLRDPEARTAAAGAGRAGVSASFSPSVVSVDYRSALETLLHASGDH